MKEDIRSLFPLGEYADRCSIECNIGKYKAGLISYGIPNAGTHRCFVVHTEKFCSEVGMDDVTTLQWVLKYGDKLPRRINEIEGELHD